jgi:hypothetical protein
MPTESLEDPDIQAREHSEHQSAQEANDEEEKYEYVLTCRVCGAVLCRASELLQDDVNQDPSCGSYFLEAPLDWMDEAASTVSILSRISGIRSVHGFSLYLVHLP